MKIYLMVKQHRVTGLKYLCKTIRDPYKYHGSGHYWKRHLKIHGKDIETTIIRECNSHQEVREWGIYYSNLWNVVKEIDENGKKTWANERVEEGDGGDTSKFIDYSNFSEKLSGKNNPMYGKSAMKGKSHTDDTKKLQSVARKKYWDNLSESDKKERKTLFGKGDKNPMHGKQPTNNPGIKIEYNGIVYNSISLASKSTGVSQHFIKKNGKIL